jgi:hypothetical protein
MIHPNIARMITCLISTTIANIKLNMSSLLLEFNVQTSLRVEKMVIFQNIVYILKGKIIFFLFRRVPIVLCGSLSTAAVIKKKST